MHVVPVRVNLVGLTQLSELSCSEFTLRLRSVGRDSCPGTVPAQNPCAIYIANPDQE